MTRDDIQEIEVQLLLQALYLRYGHDFRHYAGASLKRHILRCLDDCAFEQISEIIPHLLHHGHFRRRLIAALSVTVTEMFRDPAVFLALRREVIPVLRTFPFVNIWLAGCATGEEAYAMAILLREEKLYDRARIFATDLNDDALQQAKEGVYPLEKMRAHEANYRQAGGSGSLSDHYHAKYDMARMDPDLRRNIVFANHNLVTDGVFCETELILCRNVLIYFDMVLQNRVLSLFADSLQHGGFLCLGAREHFRFHDVASRFVTVSEPLRIFKKRDIPE